MYTVSSLRFTVYIHVHVYTCTNTYTVTLTMSLDVHVHVQYVQHVVTDSSVVYSGD